MQLNIVFLFVVLISASVSVDALWSRKCSESEISTDKVVRLLLIANCTLQEKRARLYEGLKSIHGGIQAKVQDLSRWFSKNTTVAVGADNLDYAIDVRMNRDENDDDNLVESVNEEEEEELTTVARLKRDEENEEEIADAGTEASTEIVTEENIEAATDENTEISDDQSWGTTSGPLAYRVLIAPPKCRPGQRFVDGRCRTLVFDDY